MATVSQLIRKPRKRKAEKSIVPALQGSPQKRGKVLAASAEARASRRAAELRGRGEEAD